MTLLADLLSTVFERRYRGATSGEDDDRTIEEMAAALVGTSGEVSGRTLATNILVRYTSLPDQEKRAFFEFLATAMNLDAAQVRNALSAYEDAPNKTSYRAFLAAIEPARQELFRRLNQVPGATGQLVRMRAELLRLGGDDDALQALDLDLRHLFTSWFNRGFLVLRRISWESPAHILEKIIAYEAVHAIDSWSELRNRLEPSDRRCFAFFHPAMPDEPLIFVEVALTQGVPGSVQSLLLKERETLSARDANTAVFYSISNCQAGLAGISFGSSLIKQVVADLSAELPGLKTFVTLSPVPGMMRWVAAEGAALDVGDPKAVRAMAAHYLLAGKRPDGRPDDPVARFHLGNGAMLHAVHAKADTSPKGIAQSAGAMVNYLYDLKKVARNHETFATSHKVIASAEVRALAASVEKPTA